MTLKINQVLSGWKCPIHGEYSNLDKCAWPDCPHGVTKNSVEANIPMMDKIDTFHRISWRGPDNDAYHHWQSHEMPSWFYVTRPYEYFKNKLVKNVSLNQMSHYTSSEGALAILQSGCLRFTDYAYLNDTREVTYGLDILQPVLDAYVGKVESQTLSELKARIEDGDPFSPFNIYTASFSSDPNSLSQFRLYGPIALGFELNSIGFGYPKGDIKLEHAIYDSAKQVQLIEVFFDLIKQSEEMDCAMIEKDETKQVTADYLIGQLLSILAFFKHPAFADEKEVRLLYSEPFKIMDRFNQDTAQRQFRVSGGLIVPFTDSSSTIRNSTVGEKTHLPKKLPLKSVVIGPTRQANALANGMRDLLSFMGYHEIDVILSEAPLRS